MKYKLILTALLATGIGIALASPASATPCKHATTTTTAAPTTTTSIKDARPPCPPHSSTTSTTVVHSPTANSTTSTVKLAAPAVTSTSTSVPPDDSIRATAPDAPQSGPDVALNGTDYNLPYDSVQLATAQAIEQPQALAQTGLPLGETVGASLVILAAGTVLIWAGARQRRNAIEGKGVTFE